MATKSAYAVQVQETTIIGADSQPQVIEVFVVTYEDARGETRVVGLYRSQEDADVALRRLVKTEDAEKNSDLAGFLQQLQEQRAQLQARVNSRDDGPNTTALLSDLLALCDSSIRGVDFCKDLVSSTTRSLRDAHEAAAIMQQYKRAVARIRVLTEVAEDATIAAHKLALGKTAAELNDEEEEAVSEANLNEDASDGSE